MTEGFQPPLRATGHCRHYSYERGKSIGEGGPRCAVGCGMTEPLTTRACMPWDFPALSSTNPCDLRAEYTAEERAAWEEWKQASMKRLADAIAALPAPLPLGCVGHVDCPSCGGILRWGRWHRVASIRCETPYCAEARFNIDAGADWPTAKQGA